MTFLEFLKTFWITILSTIIMTLLIILVFHYLVKWIKDMKEETKIWTIRARNIMITTMWIGVAIGIIFSSSLNLIPRSKINTNPLEQQQQQWENNHK